MRLTLPIAALVVAVVTGLGPVCLRADSPQVGQTPASPQISTRITGRVVSGAPPSAVASARVEALANGRLVASALTDAGGGFTVDAPATVTTIVVNRLGFAEHTQRIDARIASSAPLEIALKRAATVSGRVIDAAGRPIVSIRVNVVPLETSWNSRAMSTVTDDRGVFRISGLAPVAYSISSDGRPEYQNTTVNASLSIESVRILQQNNMPVSPSSDTQTFRAEEGRETAVTLSYRDSAVVLPYAEVGGAISGHVVDEFGDPAPGVTVRLARISGPGTSPSAISNVPRVTDDRGDYRLFHIPAGQYFLVVTDESRSASSSEPAWLPVYFPGSMTATEALPLTVARSQEQSGIDVIFTRSRGSRVSGIVLNAAGQPLRTQVRLQAQSALSGMQLPPRVAMSNEEGGFEFGSVAPGQYTLKAASTPASATIYAPLAGSPVVTELTRPAPEYGLVRVSVHSDDVGPVVVQTGPGASIAGRLVLETASTLSGRPTITFAALATGDNFPMTDQPAAMIQASLDAQLQNFKISGLTGTMRLRITAGPKNWWLKSAMVNGIDATVSPITLTSSLDSTEDAVFVVADTAGSVSGQALSGREPAEEGWAVLFAVDRAQRFNGSPRMAAINLESEGRFTASNLPPGDYYVTALDGAVPLPKNEVPFLELLDALTLRARRITVAPRQAVTLPQGIQVVAR